MRFFGRTNQPPAPEPEETELDLQEASGLITEAFDDHDKKALAKLTPQQRAEQAHLRFKLQQYVSDIWEAPKAGPNGRHPVDIGGYEGVAALLDLMNDLVVNADDAQFAADEEPAEWTVKTTVERYE